MKTEQTEKEKLIERIGGGVMTLPNDISRCSNERCEKKLKCKRYLDCLPWVTYLYTEFNEKDCEFFY